MHVTHRWHRTVRSPGCRRVELRLDGPAHALYLHPQPRRLRAVFPGETVLDTLRPQLLHETAILPRYYVPAEDVRWELLESTDHTTHCPFKGDARYWTLRVGDRVAENVVWNYPEPIEGAPDFADLVSFYWEPLDHWYEEDEEVFVHPRDPFHRIDVLPTSRHVRVSLDGTELADTTRAQVLHETACPRAGTSRARTCTWTRCSPSAA